MSQFLSRSPSPSSASTGTGLFSTCSAVPVTQARLLTELDHIRISKQLMRPSSPLSAEAAAQIKDVLQNAELISSYDVPCNVVTMYSQVLVADMPSGLERKLTLCYPPDAEPMNGFVSVFSPVGTSLLGLSAGQCASWAGPDGRPASAQIMSVTFQPEESGDYLL